MRLSSTFRKISEQFKIDFDELAREVSHPSLSGEAREFALRNLLEKLPKRVGIETGIVIDAHGGESKQIDVIIYDRTVGTIFEISGIKHFPCETVIAVGEVKSDILSTRNLQDALDKIESVKKLDRSNDGKNQVIIGPGVIKGWVDFDPTKKHRDQIFGFIFTSTSMTRETIISYLQNYNKQTDRRYWMNLFCDFNKFLFSYEIPEALSPSAMDATYFYCTNDSEVPDLLLLFYCILATFVSEAHVAKPNYFSYAEIDETKATYHELFPEKEVHNGR